MTLRSPHFLVLILAGGFLASLPAQTVMMPVDRVRPGMHGIGVTVFAGTERTEFSAEILGILQNSIGPRRHLILARLKGQTSWEDVAAEEGLDIKTTEFLATIFRRLTR